MSDQQMELIIENYNGSGPNAVEYARVTMANLNMAKKGEGVLYFIKNKRKQYNQISLFFKKKMIKLLIIFLVVTFLLIIIINTRVFLNSWLLLNDSVNYIPGKSSVFTFKPTKIDSGSGGYWRYGEDYTNYYYFSEKEVNTYFYTPKELNCVGFDKYNYETWCKYNKFLTPNR